jgi:hypothetical protein
LNSDGDDEDEDEDDADDSLLFLLGLLRSFAID